MAKLIVARVAQKILVAPVSWSENRASPVGDKSLRGQNRAQANSAPARLRRKANSAANGTILAPKKRSTRAANLKVGSQK
jgi:hypothetical protein